MSEAKLSKTEQLDELDNIISWYFINMLNTSAWTPCAITVLFTCVTGLAYTSLQHSLGKPFFTSIKILSDAMTHIKQLIENRMNLYSVGAF